MGHLSLPTLVLNKAWQPIAVISVRRAIVQVSVGSARFLDDDYVLHNLETWLDLPLGKNQKGIFLTKGRRMKIPEIIVLNNYDKFPEREVRLTRRTLLVRDQFTCQYTQVKLNPREATIDHIIPQSRGGKTTWDNVVICSVEANRRKANRTPEEANMKLLSKPTKPSWNPMYSHFARLSLYSKIPNSWKKFIPQSWKMKDISQ